MVAPAGVIRVLVFVDYSNLRASLRGVDPDFMVDVALLGRVLAEEGARLVEPGYRLSYQGIRLYGSYDPDTEAGKRQRHWYEEVVGSLPGVTPVAAPRRRKRTGVTCRECRHEMHECVGCGRELRGTEEKGVDTRLATDMISAAWDGAYDAAVLVTSDRDFVPVVSFLESRIIKVVHGAFPPVAAELSRACWGRIDVRALRERFRYEGRPARSVNGSR